jgi:integrase
MKSMLWTEYRNGPRTFWVRTAPGSDRRAGDLASPTSHDASPLVERERWEHVGEMTVAEFVQSNFLPEHIASKRTPGRRHYQAILKHIINPVEVDRMFKVDAATSKSKLRPNPNWPYMDNLRLCDVRPEHVQRLISAALDGEYSTQTAKHIRNVVSAIFSHAIREGHFAGGNPAIVVNPPGMTRKTAHTLTFEQMIRVLEVMRYPEREMTLIALLTGMNVAEICGLQWRYVNLTDHSVNREEESIPPRSISVKKQWYRGELSEVPEGRRKNIPMPHLLRSIFSQLSRERNSGWNDFVLTSRVAKPVNQINIAARRLKAIGEQLELPWLSWQVFRRTRAQLIYEFGAQFHLQLTKAIGPKLETSRISTIAKGRSHDHRNT